MTRLRVVLADAGADERGQLRALLARDHDVVGDVADGAALVGAVRALAPDVVVSNVDLPKVDGVTAVRTLRLLARHVPVVFVADDDDGGLIDHVLRLKPCGYILRGWAHMHLANAVRAVAGGRLFVSSAAIGEG